MGLAAPEQRERRQLPVTRHRRGPEVDGQLLARGDGLIGHVDLHRRLRTGAGQRRGVLAERLVPTAVSDVVKGLVTGVRQLPFRR